MTKRFQQQAKKSDKTSVKGNQKFRKNSTRVKAAKEINSKPSDILSTTGRDNDPNWYFTDANIASLAASISFDNYLGVDAAVQTEALKDNGDSVVTTNPVTIPSIMSIGVSPSPGDTDSTQQGINLAALKMYSELSALNAKATSYAPQDLTILMLSLGEVISIVEHIRRAFGVAFTYNMRNRDLPTNLLKAMGFDPDDFLNSIAEHRLQFNTMITAINKIPFLSNISYFYKCADIYQKVYTDDSSAMAQIILLCPHTTWVLKEDYNDNGSGLVTTSLPTPTNAGTFKTWMNILKDMVDKLFQSATFNYIYSDVLNYSTKKGADLLFFDYLLEGYAVVPEYNENFITQIHNSTIVGEVYKPKAIGRNATGNDVACKANKNQIVYNATFKAVNKSALLSTIFDFPTDTPSTEDIIEASRFTSLGSSIFKDSDEAGTYCYFASSFPDHYFNVAYILDSSSAGSFITLTSSIINDMNPDTITYLSKFTGAPLFYYVTYANAGTNAKVPVLGDTTFFTTISRRYLSKVNDIAMLSLFTLR